MRLWTLSDRLASNISQSLSDTLIARCLTSNSRVCLMLCKKGSLVSDKALRFDFAQPEAITGRAVEWELKY